MGSGVWFKNIISKKKVKGDRSQILKKYSPAENINVYQEGHGLEKVSPLLVNGASVENQGRLAPSIEDAAATRIQTAYRAYLARKTFRRMRGMVRLQNLTKCDTVKNQASTTLIQLQSWSRMQAQIRSRRIDMATEGRIRQKKLENQLKLEEKLHDLEVDWSGGSETMDVALARIHKREEAAVKRERAMAYAFSHQWRANSNLGFGSGYHELSKENWGWSWMDRWIAARPWEGRVTESPKKACNRQPSRSGKNAISPTSKAPVKAKLNSPNVMATRKNRKLSTEASDQKTAAQKLKSKTNEEKVKNEQERS